MIIFNKYLNPVYVKSLGFKTYWIWKIGTLPIINQIICFFYKLKYDFDSIW